MTATFWLSIGQTVVFLAVCGYAAWTARLIAEAANNSAQAVEQAQRAAIDAERSATRLCELREALGAWLDQQHHEAVQLRERQAQVAVSFPSVRTDTAEAQAVITPEAITTGGPSLDPARSLPAMTDRSRRGRHARTSAPRRTSALRLVAARTTALRLVAARSHPLDAMGRQATNAVATAVRAVRPLHRTKAGS